MAKVRSWRDRQSEDRLPPRVKAEIRREVRAQMSRQQKGYQRNASRPIRDGGHAGVRGGVQDSGRPVRRDEAQRIAQQQAEPMRERTPAMGERTKPSAVSRTREPIMQRRERARVRGAASGQPGMGDIAKDGVREAAMFGPGVAIRGAAYRAVPHLAAAEMGVRAIPQAARQMHGMTAAMEGAERTMLGDTVRQLALEVQSVAAGMETFKESVERMMGRRDDIFALGGDTSLAKDNRWRNRFAQIELKNKEMNNAIEGWRAQRVNRAFSESNKDTVAAELFRGGPIAAIKKAIQEGSNKP